jgi:hypothetical protein
MLAKVDNKPNPLSEPSFVPPSSTRTMQMWFTSGLVEKTYADNHCYVRSIMKTLIGLDTAFTLLLRVGCRRFRLRDDGYAMQNLPVSIRDIVDQVALFVYSKEQGLTIIGATIRCTIQFINANANFSSTQSR